MSIADAPARHYLTLPDNSIEFPVSSHGIPMTQQNRIRFECFLIVGHAGDCIDYQCLPQADFEVDQDGLRTIAAFANRIDTCLRRPEMEEEFGGPVSRAITDAIREYIFSLDDGVSRDINFRMGTVSLCGRTSCTQPWREHA